MKIKIADLQMDENRIYEGTIERIEYKTGNFGDYMSIQISTDYGNTNYVVGLSARGKLIRLLHAAGYNVNEMKSEDEIDMQDLVGKKIGVRLAYSSEGYLRVQSVMRLEEKDSTIVVDENVSADDIFA